MYFLGMSVLVGLVGGCMLWYIHNVHSVCCLNGTAVGMIIVSTFSGIRSVWLGSLFRELFFVVAYRIYKSTWLGPIVL